MSGYELYLEGCGLLENGEYEKAAEIFERSLAIEPHFKTCERLSECCEAMNETEKAFEYASKAYSLNPRNDKIGFRYAELLVRHKNDLLRARKVLLEILARNSSYKAARVMLDEIGG